MAALLEVDLLAALLTKAAPECRVDREGAVVHEKARPCWTPTPTVAARRIRLAVRRDRGELFLPTDI